MRKRLFKTDERISEVYNRIGAISFHILSVAVWLNLIYRIVVLDQEWREFVDIAVVLVFIVILYIVIISYFIREAAIDSKKESPSRLSIAALVTGILAGALGMLKITMPLLGRINSIIIPLVFLLVIAAFVCGGIDLIIIKVGRNSKKGRGFDIAGIVLAAIPVLVVVGFIVYSVYLPESSDVPPTGSFSWSPDGKKITFISAGQDSNSDIHVMNADGSGLVNLTNSPEDDWEPSWSPDGKKITFVSVGQDRNSEIYVMNVDGSDLVNLTNSPEDESNPIWSPDGKKITFVSAGQDGNYEIYVMNVDGSDLVNLTNSPEGEFEPIWSPDSKKITFSSNRNGNREIYIMNADGSGLANLTNSPEDEFGPIWSPDGKKIAFTFKQDERDDNLEIYTMNADGSGLVVNLTNSLENNWGPIWSPDGKKIAFMSAYNGKGEIYIMNADGSGQTRLTGAE